MNEQIFQALHGLANKNLFIDLLSVFFAQYSLYILVFFAITLIVMEKNFRRRYYFLVLLVLSITISSGIVTTTMHYLIDSPRPVLVFEDLRTLIITPDTSSIPSGHMMFIIPLALTMFYLNRNAGWWFIGTAILMGITRVIAGVHWPLDIVAGLFLGSLCFYLAKELLRWGGVEMPSKVHEA